MKVSISKLLKTFKYKILLSFLAFNSIFVIWIFIYFVFNKNQKELRVFISRLEHLQDKFTSSKRNLQYFSLVGFHQDTFYLTHKQANLDLFFENQFSNIKDLRFYAANANKNGIKVEDEIKKLISLHTQLMDSVNLLKEIYLKRGFYDNGLVGVMRNDAHLLERDNKFNITDLLTLRRREKDYMLWEQKKYILEFDTYMDSIERFYAKKEPTYTILLKYRKEFDSLTKYTERINLYQNNGLYSHIQLIINELDMEYGITYAQMTNKVTKIDREFKYALIVLTIIIFVLAIVFTNSLSNMLTKDILILNKKVAYYIETMFKDEEDKTYDKFVSKITEVEQLNKNFSLLKQTLKLVLQDLEHKMLAEQKASSDLAKTITQLYKQMEEVERQRIEIENSEAKLNVFFNSSASAHIMVDSYLDIIVFNNV